MPRVNLVLTAVPMVAGYWSDGTANVDVDVTLRNDGKLALNTPQLVTLACPGDCGGETNLALEDGFKPSTAQFTLRLPIGRTLLEITYGGDEPLTLNVDVPERILGVDRRVWECYSDRPPEPRRPHLYGCFGSGSQTVEKWLNDVPIKVWATGDPRHIDALRQVLGELAPIMRMEFKWVLEETDADLRAHVGIPRSEAPRLGFDWEGATDAWGFASWSSRNGEVTFGYVVIWHLGRELSDVEIRRVTVHEVLHALLPAAHNTRPVSSIGAYPDHDAGAGLNTWSHMDRSLLELNYHPLVRPGMSMREVREVIVLAEELLDQPTTRPDAREALWRAYAALEEAGSARFKVSGGWIDRRCNLLFGRRRGPIEWTMGRFYVHKYDPGLTFLDIHTDQFIFGYSRKEGRWGHWRLAPSGTWEMVDRSVLTDATHWALSSIHLHRTVRALLSVVGDPVDIAIEQTDGNLVLSATMDASRIWATAHADDWSGEVSLEVVLDPETFAIRGFTLEERIMEVTCSPYRIEATDGQIGVTLEVPANIREFLSD